MKSSYIVERKHSLEQSHKIKYNEGIGIIRAD